MKNKQGFTLIEVMIAVVIVAVIVGFAVPSYQRHITTTYRSEAREMLSEIAVAQEKFFFQSNRYGTLNDIGLTADGTLNGNEFVTSASENYDIILVLSNCQDVNGVNSCLAYDLQATAKASGDQAKDTECQQLSLSHVGRKSAMSQGGSAGDSTEECW